VPLIGEGDWAAPPDCADVDIVEIAKDRLAASRAITPTDRAPHGIEDHAFMARCCLPSAGTECFTGQWVPID
jgi:hypothetical protein